MLPISGGWKPKVRVPTCSGPGDGRRPLLAVFTWQEGRGQRARVPSEKGANAFGGLHLHDRISITSGARASTREFGGTHPPAHSILRLTSQFQSGALRPPQARNCCWIQHLPLPVPFPPQHLTTSHLQLCLRGLFGGRLSGTKMSEKSGITQCGVFSLF